MKFCIKQNKYLVYIITVLLQVVLFFIFIVIFYFTYVKNVIKESFIDQINYVTDDLTKQITPFVIFIPQKIKTDLIDKIDILIKDIEKDKNNKNIDSENQNLENISMDVSIALIAGLLIFLIIISLANYCIYSSSLLTETILSLAFIALTEFSFLQLIAKNYKAADPNHVRYSIFSTLNKVMS